MSPAPGSGPSLPLYEQQPQKPNAARARDSALAPVFAGQRRPWKVWRNIGAELRRSLSRSGSVAVVDVPQTQYARSGDVSIAYQVLGDGPLDVVFVPPHVSNVELVWEIPSRAAGMRRLAEFCRVITFDKRGTGLSDRISGVPSLEERMDDVRAVMDEVGSSRAALLGVLEGGPMSILFAATYPERCLGLALYSAFARAAWAADHSWRPTAQELEREAREYERAWATRDLIEPLVDSLHPNVAAEEREALIATFASIGRAQALAPQQRSSG